MDEALKASEAVLILARTWAIMAFCAFALYFVLVAIESRHDVQVEVHEHYRVPVEVPETEEVPLPTKKEG